MQPAAADAVTNTQASARWALSTTERLPRALTTVQTAPAVSPYYGWGAYAKRGFDLIAVAVALPLLVPLMALISVAIVVSSPGNPFFLHPRVGQGGRVFRCIKFRTMYPDAETRLFDDAELYVNYVAGDFKLRSQNDPRLFRFGRVLRRTSLDELPQVFNVILGHMSLVGPRPVVPVELDLYGPWRYAYLALRPGITGRWQINGRNHIRYPDRARLDSEYLRDWTFLADVVILLRTIPAVIRRRGNN
jgi:exopolysaccharide production protein ExoY